MLPSSAILRKLIGQLHLIEENALNFIQDKAQLAITTTPKKWLQNYGAKGLATNSPVNFHPLQKSHLACNQNSLNNFIQCNHAKFSRTPKSINVLQMQHPLSILHHCQISFRFLASSVPAQNRGLSQGRRIVTSFDVCNTFPQIFCTA